MNLKDERLHSVGFGQIEKIAVPQKNDEEIKVDVSFRGGVKITLSVPRSIIYPSGSGSPFAERQMVFVDFELVETNVVKTFRDNTYAASDLSVGRVVEFRPLTKEEKA